MVEEHRASILPIVKVDPDKFLELIVHYGCVNIFKMLYPIITFSKNLEDNGISFAKNKSLLNGAGEIEIMLLDTNLINSDAELLLILPSLLESIAESNATDFFEKLKTKYPRLPEMIRSRKLTIEAGAIAARQNHGEILDLLLQNGVDIDIIEKFYGNALYSAIAHGAIKCVEILLKHGAKLATDAYNQIWDPMMVAVQVNNLDLVNYFLEENVTGLQRSKETFAINEVKANLNAFHFAIQMGRKEIAKFFIERNPSFKNVENGNEGSFLQSSAKKRYLEMCQWLVDEEVVDVNTLRPSGEPTDWSSDENFYMDHFLILQKKDINMTDERGKTALHCAAEHGYLDRVQELIQSGANIRAVDENGWNAFHFACKSESKHQEKVIRLLHNTDSQLSKEKTKSGQTGLHIYLKFRYFSTKKARFLVEEIGVDVRAEDNKGRTVLRIAHCRGKKVDFLMTKEINLEVKNQRGRTCLHLAAKSGDIDALQTWIDLGGDLNVVDNEGLTALHFAAKGGHLQFVKMLLACQAEEARNPDVGEGSVGSALKENVRVNICDNLGRTPMHLAAQSENFDLVKLLLENGADLTLTDMERKNAIHYAINNEGILRFINEKNGSLLKQSLKDGSTSLHLALESYNVEDDGIIRWILEQGDIDLNAKNDFGDTPLLLACKKMFWRVAELLLTSNVEVNVSNKKGKTAMHYAAKKGNVFLVKLMHGKGADFTLTDNKGLNTLHSATGNFEVFLFLHEKNNTLLIQRLKNGDSTLHLAIRSYHCMKIINWLVKQCQIDLNSTNSEGETPLLLACKRGEWIIAQKVLAKRVDVNAKDKKGRTALHYTMNFTEDDGLEDLHAFDLVQELCKRGADLASTDNDGMNAFHHAMRNFRMALFIHELNGDLVNQRVNNGDTTLHLAIKVEKFNPFLIVHWLVEQGGVDLNARNALNETPLILACKKSHWFGAWDIIEILLSKNVDVNIRDNKGKTARDYLDDQTRLKRFDEIVASNVDEVGE
ncbi:ankyrin-3-like [Cloeon dipterum]|uniref:ankyrin-3-like n=1 Tax=Cloeon dipterum TaxID=197152 RepID=UPI00321F7A5D